MADNRKLPTCENCGAADTYRLDLPTRPAVYGCDACMSLFTRYQRAPDPQTARAYRKCLVQRWDQLADDVWRLLRDLRRAPDGAFSEQEARDAARALDRMQDDFVNERPRLPASRYGKAKNHRLLRLRAAYLDALTAEYREAAEKMNAAEEVRPDGVAGG